MQRTLNAPRGSHGSWRAGAGKETTKTVLRDDIRDAIPERAQQRSPLHCDVHKAIPVGREEHARMLITKQEIFSQS